MKFDKVTEWVSAKSASHWAFLWAAFLIVAWFSTGPFFKWSDSHSLFINTVTTVVTFLLGFLIQNAQARNVKALHAKLDELIRVTESRNELMGIEELSEEEIENVRPRSET